MCLIRDDKVGLMAILRWFRFGLPAGALMRPRRCATALLALGAYSADCFPTLPKSTHTTKAYKKDGRRKLEVLSLDAEAAALGAMNMTVSRSRLAGEQAPIALYRHGPYDWPSLALREESDKVFESSGVIGWCVTGTQSACRTECFHATVMHGARSQPHGGTGAY